MIKIESISQALKFLNHNKRLIKINLKVGKKGAVKFTKLSLKANQIQKFRRSF